MPKHDRMHLEQHGTQWRVRLRVPVELREVYGKVHVVVALQTDSLSTAIKRKGPVVAKLKKEFEAARIDQRDAQRRLQEIKVESEQELTEEALRWRKAIQDADNQSDEDEGLSDRAQAEFALDDFIESRTHERTWTTQEAETFKAIAYGKATPLLPLIDAWLKEKAGLKPSGRVVYRRITTAFAKAVPTIEQVNRRVAGDWLRETYDEAGKHSRTRNKAVSALSTLWKWLIKRGYLPDEATNPWAGQGIGAKDSQVKSAKKKAFTPEQLKRLLTCDEASRTLRDAMWIAVHSGMRVGELARIKVSDIEDDGFRITEAKTDAGNRWVPIHSAIRAIVEKRTKETSDGRLFSELPEVAEGSPTSAGQNISYMFTRLMRRLEMDQKSHPSQRQGDLDFHSFRRTFVTLARNAGQPTVIVSSVVGHKQQGMTDGVYYKEVGAKELLRACVEAVKPL